MDIEPSTDGMSELLAALDDAPTVTEQEADEAAPDVTEAVEEQAEEQPQDEPAVEVVDLDGKKLEIPAGTPPELVASVQRMAADLKADYTRKTQATAEQHKAIEQRAQALQAQQAALVQSFDKAVELKQAVSRVQQFQQVDWQALADADPAQATKLMAAYQTAQAEVQAKQAEWQSVQQQQQQMTAQERAQSLRQAAQKLKEAIPEFSADLAKKISDATVKNYGFAPDELANITDPRLVQILNDARQWRDLQATKPKAVQKVAQAPKVIKPGQPRPNAPSQAARERFSKDPSARNLMAFL